MTTIAFDRDISAHVHSAPGCSFEAVVPSRHPSLLLGEAAQTACGLHPGLKGF